MKWIVLGIAVIMYALVIAFQSKKVWFSVFAGILIIFLGAVYPGSIFILPEDIVALDTEFALHSHSLVHSVEDIISWNVLLIYIGSMIIASLFIYSRLPARIADGIVNNTRNTGLAMVAILAMTGIISIFVENVATVLVMAPIAIALSKKLKIDPTLFMMGLAVMSNLEGTATLVGDPPSMIFANYAGYNFLDFFVHEGKISIFFIIQAGLLAGCIFFYFFFAKNSKNKVEVAREKVISWFPLVLLILMILGLAGISFVHTSFEYLSGLFVFGLGLLGLFWYMIFQKKGLRETMVVIKNLDWETIFFLIGIFVVVGGIKETGLLDDLAYFLSEKTNGSVFLGFIIILTVSIVISGFVDNVPYIIAMLPVASRMAFNVGIGTELYMFALLVGSCLGGNLTPYGASANIVSMGILKKEGYPMKVSDWLKIGVPFTIITTVVSSVVLWFVWS